MLAVKINDPHSEEYLAAVASKQGKSRQAIVRELIRKAVEDAEDYQAAVAALKDPRPAIPLSAVMKRHGLAY